MTTEWIDKRNILIRGIAGLTQRSAIDFNPGMGLEFDIARSGNVGPEYQVTGNSFTIQPPLQDQGPGKAVGFVKASGCRNVNNPAYQ